MEKIIKYGFQPVVNNVIHGQNDEKGKKLFKSKHVYGVVEKTNKIKTVITGKVVPQTGVSNFYDVTISVDSNRHVSNTVCTCKAGLEGKCKHICALIHYVNSPETSSSKTSLSQQWVLSAEMTKLKPIKLTVASMPESLKNTPLRKILELEEKENIVITRAESMLQMIQSKAKEVLQEKARKVVSDLFLFYIH
ncbi:hypothetical protein WA026_013328 [Henosepilachna vigintioctopunctata]|uniref:SWIM-type domain-containing protein n=1 Tax=Henosepilachna vigintioctopunctata TaxID=420089 RepID=A0AAW1VFF3_9CUCU